MTNGLSLCKAKDLMCASFVMGHAMYVRELLFCHFHLNSSLLGQGCSNPWKALSLEALLPPLPEPTPREPNDDEVKAMIEAMFRNLALTNGGDLIYMDRFFDLVLERFVIH